MGKVTLLYVLLLSTTLVDCFCPRVQRAQSIGCSYRAHCTETVKGIRLENECQGSSNYEITIDVSLTQASDNFDKTADTDLLTIITSLTVHGNWPQTNLTFLAYMYRLKHLNLAGNKIKEINNSPFRTLSRLESISLSYNSLTDIEELFQFESHSNAMRKLFLAHNNIGELSVDTFQELTGLIELDLSFNLITDLTEEPFTNLTNLQILRLNNNLILDLNGALNNLVNLKHLYLQYNQIKTFDEESIKVLFHLETLDISKNQLDELKPNMFLRHWRHFGSHSRCKIIVSENFLTSIPNATSKYLFSRFSRSPLKNRIDVLTELDLSKNAISHIEYNAFQTTAQLISLDLSCNELITFEVNADDLRYITFLNLSTNFIKKLHFDSFSLMSNLQRLDLSNNTLEYVPDRTLINNNRLKYVNVTFNDIVDVKSLRITFHPEGGVLDLSHNGLSTLSIPAGDAVRLTDLILHSNLISDPFLIKLNHQHNLTRLDMSKNVIQVLDEHSLQLPVTLGYLDLSFNKIEKIGPSSFHRVGHLITLRLSHNYLTEIDYGVFQGLTALENLDLSFNQIGYLDAKVLLDLKFLTVLSLRHNGLNVLEYKAWLGHKYNLIVYVEGNNLSCDWLANALSDFNNGYSKMRPSVLTSTTSEHTIEGIPCKQDAGKLTKSNYVMVDERLLATSQKILEAVRDQTSYLRQYIWRSILQDAEKTQFNYTVQPMYPSSNV